MKLLLLDRVTLSVGHLLRTNISPGKFRYDNIEHVQIERRNKKISVPSSMVYYHGCLFEYCITVLFYSTVQYCTVLYSTVLYCTVLYCTVLYSTVHYSTVFLKKTELWKKCIEAISLVINKCLFRLRCSICCLPTRCTPLHPCPPWSPAADDSPSDSDFSEKQTDGSQHRNLLLLCYVFERQHWRSSFESELCSIILQHVEIKTTGACVAVCVFVRLGRPGNSGRFGRWANPGRLERSVNLRRPANPQKPANPGEAWDTC